MKWLYAFVFVMIFGSLSAQEISFGLGGLWSWSNTYLESIETRNNGIQRIYDEVQGDSVYLLTLLRLVNEDEHIFRAKPGIQAQANFDWNFSKTFSLQTGVGLRYRAWEYNADPKVFLIFEEVLGTIPDEDAPTYTESLVCDQVINNPNAFQENEFADLSTFDLFIPLGLQIAFNDNFDMGLSAVFSTPIASGIGSEFTRADFYIQDGEQICEHTLDNRKDTSGQYFRNMRWSSELSFTYWLNNIGIQALIQTSTNPLMKELPSEGPSRDQIVTTDTFKPRFMGLVVKYRLGNDSSSVKK